MNSLPALCLHKHAALANSVFVPLPSVVADPVEAAVSVAEAPISPHASESQ